MKLRFHIFIKREVNIMLFGLSLIFIIGMIILLIGIFIGSIKKKYSMAWKMCLVAGIIEICGFIINLTGIKL